MQEAGTGCIRLDPALVACLAGIELPDTLQELTLCDARWAEFRRMFCLAALLCTLTQLGAMMRTVVLHHGHERDVPIRG